MANLAAVYSVGASLELHLKRQYQVMRDAEPVEEKKPVSCLFELTSTQALGKRADSTDNLVTIVLYRVTVNEHLRNARKATAPPDAAPPLALDLHYLLSVWSEKAQDEQKILAWVMRQLHQHPVLDVWSLSEAGWDRGDYIQLIPAELSTEDVMRIWDSFKPDYRLSVSYIARVVRIDDGTRAVGRPVVAARFSHQHHAPEAAQ